MALPTSTKTKMTAITRARSSPDLDAKVRTYRAQLADWVTCSSAKTPEGKAKIDQISAKLDSVKGQIKKSDGGGFADASTRLLPTPAATSPGSTPPMVYLEARGQVGANVDTYA